MQSITNVSNFRVFSGAIASIFLITDLSYSQEVPSHYVAPRSIAMGGAYTAVAHDEAAPWTNPAGVARIRKARSRKGWHLLKFPNAVGGFNYDGRSFYDSFQTAQATDQGGEVQDAISKALEANEELADKPFWLRASVNPIVFFEVSKGSPMAAGLYSNTKAKLVIDQDDPTTTRLQATSDFGGVLSFIFSNRTNRFNFGLQLRPVFRFAFEDKVPTSLLLDEKAIQDRVKSDSNNGSATAIDFGAMWTVGDFWFPTIGFAVLNAPTGCKENYLNPFDEKRHTICGTKYGGTINNPEAESIVDPTDIRVGVSITPRLGRKFALRLAIDGHHLVAGDGTNYYGLPGIEGLKLFHAGVALILGNPLLINNFSAKMGISQGFFTFGGSIRMSWLSIDFARYGQDVSRGSTPVEDIRYLVAVSADI